MDAHANSPALWQMPRIDERDRWLAGVAAALAREVGVDPVVMRISFVLLTLSGGIGLALYAAAWLAFTYYAQRHPGRAHDPVPKGRSVRHRLAGVASIVIGAVLFSSQAFAIGARDIALWPVAVAAFGMLLAWSSGKVDWAAPYELVRAVGGLMLTALGVIGFIALNLGAAAAPKALLVSTIVLSGVVLVVAPWLWRAASQVSEARLERLRASERAELAAHLHDSVLQTLSLIQRSAGDRAATLGLARRQERELREWLFGKSSTDARDFRTALTQLAGDLETSHGVPVEVVVVGDAALDERLGATLAATREAILNAAKHSGSARIDVYAELGPTAVEVFVRDTGRGYDPAAIAEDRRGVSESIVGRMQRAGGHAHVSSEPGRGTEVALVLPRRAA
jgi:signal transduction histidine kinase